MSECQFKVGEKYTRNDIYRICKVPANKQGGNWNTGYNRYGDDWFLFVNIGEAKDEKYNYDNRFEGDDLVWYGKNGSKLEHPSIQSLIHPKGNVHIFYREQPKGPFIYTGKGVVKSVKDTSPIEIVWGMF